jgi:hypothetical protein
MKPGPVPTGRLEQGVGTDGLVLMKGSGSRNELSLWDLRQSDDDIVLGTSRSTMRVADVALDEPESPSREPASEARFPA